MCSVCIKDYHQYQRHMQYFFVDQHSVCPFKLVVCIFVKFWTLKSFWTEMDAQTDPNRLICISYSNLISIQALFMMGSLHVRLMGAVYICNDQCIPHILKRSREISWNMWNHVAKVLFFKYSSRVFIYSSWDFKYSSWDFKYSSWDFVYSSR